MKISERIRTSVFLKIVLIFLVAHSLIATIGYSTHRYFNAQHHQRTMMLSIAHHSKMLAKRIAIKADSAYARALCDSLHIQVRFHIPGQYWQSQPSVPAFQIPATKIYADSSWMDDKATVIEIKNMDGQFLFAFNTEISRDIAAMKWRILIPIALMMLILTAIYFIIRHMLRPIRDLDNAAKQLSAGQMDINLNTARCDELGDLMRSFSDMSKRIKKMLQARDQLLLDASHELRSPLTRIKVALEFLPQEASTENIREDIKEMESMLAELLETERLDSPHGGLHVHPLDLPIFIRNLAGEYPQEALHLTLPADKQHLNIEADAERLKMALGNLITNALKYGRSEAQAVEVLLSENEDQAIIEVKDFGPGIPQEDLPFIFEPFYRVDKSRAKNTGGYGLGLSLTKKIIETHGGSIQVESIPQKGCNFTIVLQKKFHKKGDINV